LAGEVLFNSKFQNAFTDNLVHNRFSLYLSIAYKIMAHGGAGSLHVNSFKILALFNKDLSSSWWVLVLENNQH
jgi:hypothetical protein